MVDSKKTKYFIMSIQIVLFRIQLGSLFSHLTHSHIHTHTHTTYICMVLKTVLKRPSMPRNSTLLRFFTVYSWNTLEMAYSVALTSTRPSPSRMLLAGRRDRDTQVTSALGSRWVVVDEPTAEEKNTDP